MDLSLEILLERTHSVLHMHLCNDVRWCFIRPGSLRLLQLVLDRLCLLAERHSCLEILLRHIMMLRVVDMGLWNLGCKNTWLLISSWGARRYITLSLRLTFDSLSKLLDLRVKTSYCGRYPRLVISSIKQSLLNYINLFSLMLSQSSPCTL